MLNEGQSRAKREEEAAFSRGELLHIHKKRKKKMFIQ